MSTPITRGWRTRAYDRSYWSSRTSCPARPPTSCCPVTQWAEEEGTTTNPEGRVLRWRRAVRRSLSHISDRLLWVRVSLSVASRWVDSPPSITPSTGRGPEPRTGDRRRAARDPGYGRTPATNRSPRRSRSTARTGPVLDTSQGGLDVAGAGRSATWRRACDPSLVGAAGVRAALRPCHRAPHGRNQGYLPSLQ